MLLPTIESSDSNLKLFSSFLNVLAKLQKLHEYYKKMLLCIFLFRIICQHTKLRRISYILYVKKITETLFCFNFQMLQSVCENGRRVVWRKRWLFWDVWATPRLYHEATSNWSWCLFRWVLPKGTCYICQL